MKKVIASLAAIQLIGLQTRAEAQVNSIVNKPPQMIAPTESAGILPTHLLLNLDSRQSVFKPFAKEDFFSEDYNLYDYVQGISGPSK